MTAILCLVTLPMTSGLPEDAVVNDFAFNVTNLTTDIDNIRSAIDNFYNVTNSPGIFSIGSRLSSRVDRGVDKVTLDYYDLTGHLDGTPHGSPFRTDKRTINDAASATLSLPSEACIVGSYNADLSGVVEEVGNTRPRARRRGRLYIGPLNANTTTDAGLVEDQIRIAIREGMKQQLMNNPLVDWCVWSRKDATLRSVVGGFVDNAFDTQRRRGIAPTIRSTF